MKYVYVLISSENDTFYEQFLLSLTSMRINMPNADIVLLCDTKTKNTLTGKRAEYEKIITQTIAVDSPLEFSQIEISRWLKTCIHHYINDDFMYIDSDTIIADDLSEINNLGIKFGACLGRHCLTCNHADLESIIIDNNYLGFTSYLGNHYFNGGVIYCSNTPEARNIFQRWHELWHYSKSKGKTRDEPALNMAIYENRKIVSELSGIWNCQIGFNGLPFLFNSKIIHYFATDIFLKSSPFIFSSENNYLKIKELGYIPENIYNLLKNPRIAFYDETRIIASDDILHVINSNFFKAIVMLWKKTPIIFNIFEYLSLSSKKRFKNSLIKKTKRTGGLNVHN